MLAGCAGHEAPAPRQPVIREIPKLDVRDHELDEVWRPKKTSVELTGPEKAALEHRTEIHYDFDKTTRDLIKDQFVFLLRDRPNFLKNCFQRAEKRLPYAQKVFKQRGLPEELAYLPFIESGWNTRAYSPAGAAGAWQFIPGTGTRYGLVVKEAYDERLDPYKAAHAGADYLTKLYNQFGDWSLALASYNCGEGKMARVVAATGAKNFFDAAKKNHLLDEGLALRQETLEYVPRFIAMAKIVHNAENLGFARMQFQTPDVHPLAVKPGTDLRDLVKSVNHDWDSFVAENPQFRRPISPSELTATAYLPQGLHAEAIAFMNRPKPKPAVETYIVQKGDTFDKVTKSFGVSPTALRKANALKSDKLSPGQKLKIPRSGGETLLAKAEPKSGSARDGALEFSDARTASRGGLTYVVQKGDMLSTLAKRFDVPLESLKAANNLDAAQGLKAGQTLVIPGKAAPKIADKAPVPSKDVVKTTESPKKDSPKPEPVKSADASSKKRTAKKYTVAGGDTLYSIARKFDVPVADVVSWNKLNKDAPLKIGAEITLYTDKP